MTLPPDGRSIARVWADGHALEKERVVSGALWAIKASSRFQYKVRVFRTASWLTRYVVRYVGSLAWVAGGHPSRVNELGAPSFRSFIVHPGRVGRQSARVSDRSSKTPQGPETTKHARAAGPFIATWDHQRNILFVGI
jgi:hypothetical protein